MNGTYLPFYYSSVNDKIFACINDLYKKIKIQVSRSILIEKVLTV